MLLPDVVHNLGLGEITRLVGVVIEEVAPVGHQVLEVLPNVHHGVVQVVVYRERRAVPTVDELALLGKRNVVLELGAVPIDEVLIAQGHGVEAAADPQASHALGLLQRIAVGVQPDGVYGKMGLVVYARFLTPLFLGPELGAEPIAQKSDDVVGGYRTAELAGVPVKEETIGKGNGVAEEEVHLYVAVAAEGSLVDGLVGGGHDGHGKVEAPEAEPSHIAVHRRVLGQYENLVFDIPLHPGDGGFEGIGLFQIDSFLGVVVLELGVHFLDGTLRQDELLGVMHRESLDKYHGKSRVG